MEKINSTKQCPSVWTFRVYIFLKGFLIDHNLPAGAAGFFALVGDAVKFFIIIRDAFMVNYIVKKMLLLQRRGETSLR